MTLPLKRKKKETPATTSETLERVAKDERGDIITFQELADALHERGFGILLAFFSLPTCIPIIVVPPLTTLCALPLIFFSLQMVIGKDSPWLPRWLGRKHMTRNMLRLLIEKTVPLLQRIEKVLRPRLSFISTTAGERLIGVVALACGISIALPVPFTNFVPSYGVLFMSLGLLSRDGVWVLIGMLISFLGIILTLSVMVLGTKVVLNLLPFLASFNG